MKPMNLLQIHFLTRLCRWQWTEDSPWCSQHIDLKFHSHSHAHAQFLISNSGPALRWITQTGREDVGGGGYKSKKTWRERATEEFADGCDDDVEHRAISKKWCTADEFEIMSGDINVLSDLSEGHRHRRSVSHHVFWCMLTILKWQTRGSFYGIDA